MYLGTLLRDLVRHRDLLSMLTLREIRIRYARAFLGIGWALFIPIAMMAVFTVMNFGRLVGKEGGFGDLPYPVFAFTGLIFWNHFAMALTQATPSLVVSRTLLRKSRFPREVIPLAKMLSGLLDVAVGFAFLLVLMLVYRRPIGVTALALVPVFVLQILFTAGLVLLLSGANLFYRDVNYLVQVAVLLGLFVTSVIYEATATHPAARAILAANPMTSFLNAYRQALLLGEWPGPGLWVGAAGAAVSFLLGTWLFRRMSPRFVEEV